MILLFSGGLDSYIAWHYLNRPRTLYCDLGHRYARHEMKQIERLVKTTYIDRSLELGDLEKDDGFIPLRNAFLIMIASLYDPKIAIVCQKGEQDLADRSPQFLSEIQSLLNNQHDGAVEVINPFTDMTKAQMVKWYLKEGLPVKNLTMTRSCYSKHEGNCGQCSACFRRWVAFYLNDVKDGWIQSPMNWNGVSDYIKRMKAGEYEEERTKETFEVLRRTGFDV